MGQSEGKVTKPGFEGGMLVGSVEWRGVIPPDLNPLGGRDMLGDGPYHHRFWHLERRSLHALRRNGR